MGRFDPLDDGTGKTDKEVIAEMLARAEIKHSDEGGTITVPAAMSPVGTLISFEPDGSLQCLTPCDGPDDCDLEQLDSNGIKDDDD